MNMPAGMADLLARKYAILQQGADASTMQARSSVTASNAAAQLDTTRAKLMPGESAANVAQTNAQTGLLGQQAKYLGPTALSEIAYRKSQIANLDATTDEFKATSDISGALGRMGPALGSILGQRYPGLQTSSYARPGLLTGVSDGNPLNTPWQPGL